MNPFRIRPAPVGPVLSAPSRWAAAAATATKLPVAALGRPRSLTRAFSQSWAAQAAPAPMPTAAPPSEKGRVPAPIPLVPDVATFLTVIGRNMKQHTAKFPSWEALFTLTSRQLRELGIEPPRDRRYLIRWVERFRQGRFGIGGDFRYVRGGAASLQVAASVDAENPLLVHKTVVNVPQLPDAADPAEAAGAAEPAEAAAPEPAGVDGAPVRVRGYKAVGARGIAGPYALPQKNAAGARVAVAEGMWEDKRGRKIDGGERRRAEVRFKRRAAERRAERERLGGM